MPSLTALYVVSALCVSSAFARMNQAVNSRSHDHPAIARRQHQLPRTLSDLCVQIEASVLSSTIADLLDSSYEEADADVDLYAKSDICICLSSVSLFLQTDKRMQSVTKIVGDDRVEEMLKYLIKNTGVGKKCDFPEHAVPKSVRAHGCDCCDFDCEETWEKKEDKCVCESPKMECRGKCADSCTSPVPYRRGEEMNKVVEVSIHEVDTYDQARGTCDPFDTVCGVEGDEDDYDCCDILNNKKYCGGCVQKHPFGIPESPYGQNCDNIEHQKTTMCDTGKCRVQECEEGWAPNEDSTLCIEIKPDINVNKDSDL